MLRKYLTGCRLYSKMKEKEGNGIELYARFLPFPVEVLNKPLMFYIPRAINTSTNSPRNVGITERIVAGIPVMFASVRTS